ncbi:tryptophan halogenase [Sphingomonas kyeonggiensis]|uniref:tryptophan halogenase family protein n=1 Tax=Sphingomonas kyeonggiensis TaxID=1268553 RepID=UPI002786F05A|nr:tryptophan halogenase family protein [Sphingomonas kyeonggiensis]MDQ0252061.1 tryptophan halogenase [Sphingomonas kyeonggiensis]
MTAPAPIRSIVIVGGGTAGWMAAAALTRLIPAGVAVTLVESEEIGTVGVGEATIPPIRSFNALLGIDEADFLAATQGTIKLGIEFVNWTRDRHRYVHPFGEFGFDIEGVKFHQVWRKLHAAGRAEAIDAYNVCARAMQAGRYQPPVTDPGSILSRMAHAYQFDAGLYAKYLRAYAEDRGVVRIEGKVAHVPLRAEDGFIEAVVLEGDRRIEGELFLDCTGFRALLIEQTLHTGWESWAHWLQCDRAVAVPSASPGPEITPFTRATAHKAGWQWRIPLQHRVGNGHVYCSADISDDQARETLLAHLDGAPLRDPFILRFEAGRRKRAWEKNCIALGLSSGFLEPLESTSIHLIQSGIHKLMALLPDTGFSHVERDEYNRLTDLQMEQVRDFIILHYHANQRSDGDLWRRMREMAIPDTLRRKLDLFRGRGRFFRYEDELFAESSWIAVLLGQGILPQGWDPLADAFDDDKLAFSLSRIHEMFARAAQAMPRHEDWLARNAPARTPA